MISAGPRIGTAGTCLFAALWLVSATAPAHAMVGGAPAAADGVGRSVVMILGSYGTACTATAIARDLLLTGRRIEADEALRMGLVTRVVDDGALDDAAAEMAAEIARHPRAGVAATKAVVAAIRAGRPGTEAQSYAAALRSDPETRARIAAFVARKPGAP